MDRRGEWEPEDENDAMRCTFCATEGWDRDEWCKDRGLKRGR